MDLLDNVKQKATSQLDSQKGRATDGLSAIAHAVRGTTEELRRDNHDVMAQYIERMADQLDGFSTRLRDRDVTALLADARDLARRQPSIFIGGSFVAGLLAARFIKSSSRHDGDYGWDRHDEGQRSAGLSSEGARAGTGGEYRTTFGGTRAGNLEEPGGFEPPVTGGRPGTPGATGRL